MLKYSSRSKVFLFLMSYGASLSLWKAHGILRRELRILELLAKLYDKVFVVTYGDYRELEYLNLMPKSTHIIINPFKSNFMYMVFIPLIIRIIARRFSVIVCRTVQLFGCVLGIMLKLLFRAQFILRQGYQFTKFAKRNGWALAYAVGTVLEFIGYWLADYIIVSTEFNKEYIVKRYKVNSHKIVVIPNWVDVNMFRREGNVIKERGRIVYVGRLEPQKNVLALVDAVKDIPNVKLYIIGDGSLRKIIEKKIEIEGIKNVVLMGVIPNERLPRELNKSEIFVLPSFWEGHPKVLIEAMACGLPVIGADVEGIRELIQHGYNGWLCKPNSESIREAILTLLYNPELRRKLGENARKFVVENFSFESVMRKELMLHLWLMKKRG